MVKAVGESRLVPVYPLNLDNDNASLFEKASSVRLREGNKFYYHFTIILLWIQSVK